MFKKGDIVEIKGEEYEIVDVKSEFSDKPVYELINRNKIPVCILCVSVAMEGFFCWCCVDKNRMDCHIRKDKDPSSGIKRDGSFYRTAG